MLQRDEAAQSAVVPHRDDTSRGSLGRCYRESPGRRQSDLGEARGSGVQCPILISCVSSVSGLRADFCTRRQFLDALQASPEGQPYT